MPIFDFKCRECGVEKEMIVSSSTSTVECKSCGGIMYKQVSSPGGFKFNGKGFYATDYKGK